jgi:hypothetical protein
MSARMNLLSSSLKLPILSPLSDRLPVLSEELTISILTLNAYIEKKQRWEGPDAHRVFGEWLQGGLATEIDLSAWLKEKYPLGPVHGKHFDEARVLADRWRQGGIRVAVPFKGPLTREQAAAPAQWSLDLVDDSAAVEVTPSGDPFLLCPAVYFLKGSIRRDIPWVAVFNSRKSRGVLPNDGWLNALRFSLTQLAEQGGGIASSLGTLTYDLATALAQRSRSPLILAAASAFEEIIDGKGFPFGLEDCCPELVLTCSTRAIRCSRPTRMVCRDRTLAFLADLHLVLEIRSDGNLRDILESQQARQPRRQWVFLPRARNAGNEGNCALLRKFPEWSHSISIGDPGPGETERASGSYSLSLSSMSSTFRAADGIRFEDYLYHYVRACPGPWPGQAHRDYLLSLLDGDPLSGHTALDTLIRIILEGRIRAGSKLVRGDRAVVSWTSRPPFELESIRKWNPALIRWTFEPFGIGVSRKELRKRGVMPTIYARPEVYERLRPTERFRFQRHESELCSWKHEREWRLPEDLDLRTVPRDQGFVFVPGRKDLERLEALRPGCTFPVVALSPYAQ